MSHVTTIVCDGCGAAKYSQTDADSWIRVTGGSSAQTHPYKGKEYRENELERHYCRDCGFAMVKALPVYKTV